MDICGVVSCIFYSDQLLSETSILWQIQFPPPSNSPCFTPSQPLQSNSFSIIFRYAVERINQNRDILPRLALACHPSQLCLSAESHWLPFFALPDIENTMYFQELFIGQRYGCITASIKNLCFGNETWSGGVYWLFTIVFSDPGSPLKLRRSRLRILFTRRSKCVTSCGAEWPHSSGRNRVRSSIVWICLKLLTSPSPKSKPMSKSRQALRQILKGYGFWLKRIMNKSWAGWRDKHLSISQFPNWDPYVHFTSTIYLRAFPYLL